MSDGGGDFAPDLDLVMLGEGRMQLRTIGIGGPRKAVTILVELEEGESGEPKLTATAGGFGASDIAGYASLLEYTVALMKQQAEVEAKTETPDAPSADDEL